MSPRLKVSGDKFILANVYTNRIILKTECSKKKSGATVVFLLLHSIFKTKSSFLKKNISDEAELMKTLLGKVNTELDTTKASR